MKRLTVKKVEEMVENVRKHASDDEAAHSKEDSVHELVLEAISLGVCDDPAACAAAALKTKEIVFCRWYA